MFWSVTQRSLSRYVWSSMDRNESILYTSGKSPFHSRLHFTIGCRMNFWKVCISLSSVEIISSFSNKIFLYRRRCYIFFSFTTILGYYPDEVVGKSGYSFCHKDDLKIIANVHQQALTQDLSPPEVTFRFRAKAGHYVPLRTKTITFRNPWSKEVDYIITKNVVIT